MPNYTMPGKQVYTDMARYIASEFSWSLLFRLASVLCRRSGWDGLTLTVVESNNIQQ